jgi:hypothetical protein
LRIQRREMGRVGKCFLGVALSPLTFHEYTGAASFIELEEEVRNFLALYSTDWGYSKQVPMLIQPRQQREWAAQN